MRKDASCRCAPSRGRGKPACSVSRPEQLKVAVTAPPEDGRANRALTETLRELLGLKRSQVELLSGETSRLKKFLIRGVTKDELSAKLAALV